MESFLLISILVTVYYSNKPL